MLMALAARGKHRVSCKGLFPDLKSGECNVGIAFSS